MSLWHPAQCVADVKGENGLIDVMTTPAGEVSRLVPLVRVMKPQKYFKNFSFDLGWAYV